MPLATLLNPNDPLFDFEHMMQHRQVFSIMPNLYQHSVLPYLLEPPHHQDVPAGTWHKNHQQAHDDANALMPPFYSFDPVNDIQVPFRILQTSILVEGNKGNRESWTWWTFTNHQEHYTLNDAILPIPSQPPTPAWADQRPTTYPFW